MMTYTWTHGIWLISLSAILAGSGAVPAEARPDQRSGMQEEQGRSQGTSNWQKITGTVKKTKIVGLRNQDQENFLVQVQTDKGGRQIVDLGDAADLSDIDIRKGDRITAWGQPMKFEGKEVFIARKLKANGDKLDIEHPDLSFDDSQRQRMGRPSRDDGSQPYSGQSRVKGEVVAVGEVTEYERAGNILAFDRDHFYIVQEPDGRQTHLLVAEEADQGFKVGDKIQARVKPDGTVKSISRLSGGSPGESQSQAKGRGEQSPRQQDQMARQSEEAEEGS